MKKIVLLLLTIALAAALTGIAAMKLLSFVSKKSNFRLFSIYCVVVGVIAVVFA